jgi:DNA (cytosine-5)-methyltransferase 1
MKIISLFSGAGGLDLGFQKAGHKIVFSNDIFYDAVKTYENNFIVRPDQRDIKDIPSHEIPDADALIAGFPCQGFSVANRKRSARDPRNSLYKHIARVAKDKKIKIILLENVQGLKEFNSGKEFQRIIKTFSDLGYEIKSQVLNAADYGVPQKRKRLFILGIHKKFNCKIIFPPKQKFWDPKTMLKIKKRKWQTIGAALKRFPEPDTNHKIQNHEATKYKLRFNGHLGHRYINANEPAPTITARGDEKGGVVIIHHPNNKRRLTVREAAAIQTFPDKFIFFGSKTSGYRQIANSVPPKLSYEIAKEFPK